MPDETREDIVAEIHELAGHDAEAGGDLTEDGLEAVALEIDADFTSEYTVAEMRAAVMNRSGRTAGATGEDFEDGLKKHELDHLRNFMR